MEQGSSKGLGVGLTIASAATALTWGVKIFLPTQLGYLNAQESLLARDAIAGFGGLVLAALFAILWALLRKELPDDLDPPALESHWLAGLLMLCLAFLFGCGTTPTDRYYGAVSALAGVRASANAYCEALPQPTRTEQCAPLRPLFVASDSALEALEATRKDVLAACSSDAADPLCKDAGRRLKQAAAGTARLSTELTRWLAARGVKP